MGPGTRLRSTSPSAASQLRRGRRIIRRFTIGINERFDGIAKVIERYAKELAEQRLREKEQKTGRGPKARPEKTENKGGKEKENCRDFPKTG